MFLERASNAAWYSGSEKMMRLLVLIGALTATGACQSETREFQVGPPHPRPENLHQPVPISATIRIDQPIDTAVSFVRAVTRARPTVRIGVLEGSSEYVLGRIEDVAVDTQGRIYILDSSNKLVRVFDRAGRFLLSFGSPGQGPGEFTQVSGFEVRDSTIFVVDLAAVHVFRWRAGEVVFSHSVRPPVEPVDACAAGQRIFVHGVSPTVTELVFPLDSGQTVTGFGRLYTGLSPRARFHLNRSRIACGDDMRTIAIAARSVLGEVHGYLLSGEPRWIVRVDGYRPIDFRETEDGTRTTIPDRGYDRISTLIPAGGGMFIVQVLYLSMEDRLARNRDFTSLFTFAIAGDTGRAFSLGTRLPPIAAMGPRYFVSMTNEPFPQVTVYEW